MRRISSPTDRLILRILLYYDEGTEQGACPSRKTIAAEAGYTENTVRNRLRRLRKMGLIETKQFGPKRYAHYFVKPPDGYPPKEGTPDTETDEKAGVPPQGEYPSTDTSTPRVPDEYPPREDPQKGNTKEQQPTEDPKEFADYWADRMARAKQQVSQEEAA